MKQSARVSTASLCALRPYGLALLLSLAPICRGDGLKSGDAALGRLKVQVIAHYAVLIKTEYADAANGARAPHAIGKAKWEITADAWATLNGRPSQRLINPESNLAASVLRSWIVPHEATE